MSDNETVSMNEEAPQQEATVAPEAQSEPMQETQSISDWKTTLSDDLREEASIQDFKDVNSLAKSYVSAQKMLGNSIRIPSSEAGQEDVDKFYERLQEVPGVIRMPKEGDSDGWNRFYNKLGRPESPDAYKVEDQIPEDLPIDPNYINSFKDIAHKAGLNTQQVRELAKWQAEQNKAYLEVQAQVFENSSTQLREKWGSDFSNRVKGARAALDVLSEDFPDAVAQLRNGPEQNNPALVKLLSDYYQSLGEENHVGSTSRIQYGMAREEALEQISEIQSNKNHPFHVEADPDHNAAVEKVRRLYKVAYPEE